MRKSLVAFDTDHIKAYVFATNKLKEIRGASSVLDKLNRQGMQEVAKKEKITAHPIYMNGGSGLFLVEDEKATLDEDGEAEKFGQAIQKKYSQETKSGASITFVVQDLPEDIARLEKDKIMEEDLTQILELLRYRLREAKGRSSAIIALPSHPFMRPCDACGIAYAEEQWKEQDEPTADSYYCASCREKQREDHRIKTRITKTVEALTASKNSHSDWREMTKKGAWERVLHYLKPGYIDNNQLSLLDRPPDFNVFRQFAASKDYIGLIYADGNNMGAAIEKANTLTKIQQFAEDVDQAIHQAVAAAINKHLPIVTVMVKGKEQPLFPFDILLLGGDDIVMVTDAAKAMEVALTIGEKFREISRSKFTLSIGVVLAPVKYPFGLLQDLAEGTLKFAKKSSAEMRTAHPDPQADYDDTFINFMIVTGGSKNNFNDVYNENYKKIYPKNKQDKRLELHATLRPYSSNDLAFLLETIKKGQQEKLGRTKLHQMREAILKMNLTTSVSEGFTVLRNWNNDQRTLVAQHLYGFGGRNKIPETDITNPTQGFLRVLFPWFADDRHKDPDKEVYRTSLLDFVELYDFVAREEDAEHAED